MTSEVGRSGSAPSLEQRRKQRLGPRCEPREVPLDESNQPVDMGPDLGPFVAVACLDAPITRVPQLTSDTVPYLLVVGEAVPVVVRSHAVDDSEH